MNPDSILSVLAASDSLSDPLLTEEGSIHASQSTLSTIASLLDSSLRAAFYSHRNVFSWCSLVISSNGKSANGGGARAVADAMLPQPRALAGV